MAALEPVCGLRGVSSRWALVYSRVKPKAVSGFYALGITRSATHQDAPVIAQVQPAIQLR